MAQRGCRGYAGHATVITIATHLWRPNKHSFSFSRCYDESWVERLYRGFERNLTQPFKFICWVDRDYEGLYKRSEGKIGQVLLHDKVPDYSSCLQPYEMGAPMILVGLDTVVTGNVDALADYCLTAKKIALPRDPNRPHTCCTGVCLVPAGFQHIWTERDGTDDMTYMRRQPHDFIESHFPGQVRSFKGGETVPGVWETGLQDTRIVYFHGQSKPHELDPLEHGLLLEHWVGTYIPVGPNAADRIPSQPRLPLGCGVDRDLASRSWTSGQSSEWSPLSRFQPDWG